MSKFKVGDKVRIKKDLREDEWGEDNCLYVDSRMVRYRGEIATIIECIDTSPWNFGCYRLDIDEDFFVPSFWGDWMLEKVKERKHFKSLPEDFSGKIRIENGFIIKLENKKEILNKAEKEYLRAVIQPFKEDIISIKLRKASSFGKVFIYIELKNCDSIILPSFKKKSMYKNMILNKEYSLEELELD